MTHRAEGGPSLLSQSVQGTFLKWACASVCPLVQVGKVGPGGGAPDYTVVPAHVCMQKRARTRVLGSCAVSRPLPFGKGEK